MQRICWEGLIKGTVNEPTDVFFFRIHSTNKTNIVFKNIEWDNHFKSVSSWVEIGIIILAVVTTESHIHTLIVVLFFVCIIINIINNVNNINNITTHHFCPQQQQEVILRL